MAKTKNKSLHPAQQIAQDLENRGVKVRAFRFASGCPLLLLKSPHTGYLVWVVLHLDAKDEWSPELVEQIVSTNYGAIIATGTGDVKEALREKRYLESWHRDRLEVLLQTHPGKTSFTQSEIINALTSSSSSGDGARTDALQTDLTQMPRQ